MQIEAHGTIESIDVLSQMLLAGLETTVSKDGNGLPDCNVKIVVHKAKIMGNPDSLPEPVTIRIARKQNANAATIKIEHGAEFLLWHMTTPSLCYCCGRNFSHSDIPACYDWLLPTKHKRSCEGYKFNQKKLDEYHSRTSKNTVS